MLRRSPRSALAWLAALAVLITTARFVGGDLAAIHRQATSLGPRVDVVVARHDLPLGTTIEAGDLDVVTRHESQVPDNALRNFDDAVGVVVAVPLVADATILAAHLADPDRSGLDAVVPPGMRAVRIPLENAVRPDPGDVVDVLATFDTLLVGDTRDPTSVVAAAARVVEVESDDAEVVTGLGTTAVTVLVTADEAEQVAFALSSGIVTIAVAPPEEACCVGNASRWES